ncbi:MAG TPA: tail fiber domain-containing protein, partial [Anaerolineales bacterium]
GTTTTKGAAPNKDDFWRGDPDLWSAEVKLNPEQAQLFDQEMRTRQGLAGMQDVAVNRVGSSMAKPFSLSGAPAAGTAYDPTKDSDQAFKLMMERLAPQQKQREDAARTRLSNMGLTAGSEGWKTELDQLARDQNDQRITAALSSYDLGMRQQGQQFSQQSALRDKGIQEMLMERQQPLNELNALRSGSQVTMPTFNNVPQQANVAAPNYMGAAQNQFDANSDNFNFKETQKAQNQQMWMEMAKMAAQMFAFSDVTIKCDIKAVGRTKNGLTLYSYWNKMRSCFEIGLIAQEVQRVKPEAVRVHPNGLLQVNYALALE